MKINEGTIDRVLRVILGLGIGFAGYYYNSWFGLIGLIPSLTGLVGFCPLYALLGISSCPVKSKSDLQKRHPVGWRFF